MEYLSRLLTLSGIVLLACISPGPDVVAVTSNALQSLSRAGLQRDSDARAALSKRDGHLVAASESV